VLEEGEQQLNNSSLVNGSILPPILESRVETGEDPVPPVSAGMNLSVQEDD